MPDTQDGFAAARKALTKQLEQIDEQLKPYQELVEARKRASQALLALDGGKGLKKRIQWEQVAVYVSAHPGSRPADIGAALEVPAVNVQRHLTRNEGQVFENRKDGWHTLDGWEEHRRDS
jgi:hypothetical protein